MGMMAAKHTDPIVGMDMHVIQPPPPAPLVMVPHPVAGMVMDPADYSPGACTVYINGLPRARAGNLCMMSPPHVPVGGMFVKPPLSEAELYQGSSTVTADGEALSAMSHQVLGCHDIGAPAPVRRWKSGGAKSLMKSGSVVLPIPGGRPVMVGGVPTTSANGEETRAIPTEWLGLEFVDPDGNPVVGARFHLELADGTIRIGSSGSDGVVSLRVEPGTAKLEIRSPADAVRCASAVESAHAESVIRVLRPGEDIYSTAAAYGIGTRWKDIFEHADNRSLTARRPDPWVMAAGDVIVVPASLRPVFELEMGRVHRINIAPAIATLRVALRAPRGAAYNNAAFTAIWSPQAEPFESQTDGDGVAEIPVPVWVERMIVEVVVRQTLGGATIKDRFELEPGRLRPMDASAGILERTWNLGIARKNSALGMHLVARRHAQQTIGGPLHERVDKIGRRRNGGGAQ